MMRILILGEGPTDVGQRDYQTGQFLEGPIPIIIRKVLEGPVEMQLLDKSDRKKLKGKHFQRSIKGLSGQGVCSRWAKMQAAEQSFDVVIFYSDSDRESGSDARNEVACRKRFEEVKSNIEEGFHRAQHPEVLDLAIVPVKMIESWLMADPKAFSTTFGSAREIRGKQTKNIFPKTPELEWGDKHDASSNYPKCQLNRILSCYGEAANQDTFVRLADAADLGVLQKKCPISFKVFYQELTDLKSAWQAKEGNH